MKIFYFHLSCTIVCQFLLRKKQQNLYVLFLKVDIKLLRSDINLVYTHLRAVLKNHEHINAIDRAHSDFVTCSDEHAKDREFVVNL